MANVIAFPSPRLPDKGSDVGMERAPTSDMAGAAAKIATINDALNKLLDRLETVVQHAVAIESKMRDPVARKELRERINLIRSLMELARGKILRL